MLKIMLFGLLGLSRARIDVIFVIRIEIMLFALLGLSMTRKHVIMVIRFIDGLRKFGY